MDLRYYQQAAKSAIWDALRSRPDNPCAVLPTGSGKTPLLAALCREANEAWGARVIVVSHVKELLEQSAKTLCKWWPEVDVGVYSAGLRMKHTRNAIVVAGIQSAYKHAFDFGERNLVIVDEAHLIPNDGEGMYQTFLENLRVANPKLRVVGLTATPYRTTSGEICRQDRILNHVCYEVGIKELIDNGYLCPLVNQVNKTQVDTSKIGVRNGDFVAGEMERAFDQNSLVNAACQEIAELTRDRKSILIFSAGVSHGQHITDAMERFGVHAGFLCGDTPALERASLIANFKSGQLRCLVNVNVLTTGFDATSIDCVAVVRSTISPGLFYQMCGRGFRLHEGKADCLVLDYGGNLERHGSLDDPSYGKKRNEGRGNGGDGEAPVKKCIACGQEVPVSLRECYCGFLFPIETNKHGSEADTQRAVVAAIVPPTWKEVEQIDWSVHRKRGDDKAPPTLRVDYTIVGENLGPTSEWICIEHEGFAREKAWRWWKKRSQAPMPASVEEAIECFMMGMIADTRRIKVSPDPQNPRFSRILEYELGEVPAPEQWHPLPVPSDIFADEASDEDLAF
jgi:DNA repair protein RadD